MPQWLFCCAAGEGRGANGRHKLMKEEVPLYAEWHKKLGPDKFEMSHAPLACGSPLRPQQNAPSEIGLGAY